MRCKKCGAEMKDGSLFCYVCGEEVRMVPDYEPELEELDIHLAEKEKKIKSEADAEEEQTVFQTPEKKKHPVRQLVSHPYFIPVLLLFAAVCALGAAYVTVLQNQSPEELLGNGPEEDAYRYIASPEFSVKGGEYGYYLTVELTAGEKDSIYYTTDGSVPDEKSYVYRSPIELSEGITVIRAVAIGENGSFSEISEETYTLKFGAPDAPIVLPAAGVYTEETYVKILVPDRCVAYYTLDGSNPEESSELYTGEFLMPSGETTVRAVLQNEQGSFSEVTTVRYRRTEPGGEPTEEPGEEPVEEPETTE